MAYNKNCKGYLQGTTHIERVPDFVDLVRVPDLRHQSRKTYPFVELRKDCSDLGLTLERVKRGYLLSGRDLPVSGVECRTLYEVEEEMLNYM